ncbi:MAG: hypothetical protein ABI315_10275 [Bacteroidia bacterium]
MEINQTSFSSFESIDIYKSPSSTSHSGMVSVNPFFLQHPISNLQIYENSQLVTLNHPSKASFFTNPSNTLDFKIFFSDFINTRINYLESLRGLGDNWISGQSKQPSVEAIELSKSLLKKLRNWISGENCAFTVPPKVIMGPIPSGGISIELNFTENLSFSINIFDNSCIELEKQEDGFYSETKVDEETILDEIISRSNAYVTSI